MPDDERMAECQDQDTCAVCGEQFEDDRRFVAQEAADAAKGYKALVDDGLVMHERCAKLALAHCPHMKHGYSVVMWLKADEIKHEYGVRRIADNAEVDVSERRTMLKSTSAETDRTGWKPRLERH